MLAVQRLKHLRSRTGHRWTRLDFIDLVDSTSDTKGTSTLDLND